MTWVLVVWFWTGGVNTAPSMVSVPGFTSEVACDKAAVDMTRGLNMNTQGYSNRLFVKCVQQ